MNGSLDFQDVIGGLDQQQIRAALDQPAGLLAKNIHQLFVTDVGHFRIVGGNEFSRWSDGTGDEARFIGSGKFIRGFTGDLCRGKIDLVGFICKAVISQGEAVSPETVGFDDISASFEVSSVNPGNSLRRRKSEIVITAQVALSAKIHGG